MTTLTTMTGIHGAKPHKLCDGTQEIPLREAYDARCRCGSSLTWTLIDWQDNQPAAECDHCPMVYTVTETTVKIEGFDRSAL